MSLRGAECRSQSPPQFFFGTAIPLDCFAIARHDRSGNDPQIALRNSGLKRP